MPTPSRRRPGTIYQMVQNVASSEDRPVADSAETPYVFLDTEVLRAHQLDFQSPNIRRLLKLAADGPVRLQLSYRPQPVRE